MRSAIALLVSVFMLVCAGDAAAREIHVNGVRIGPNFQLANQVLSQCEVRFDAAGDVWITAKDYSVKLIPADPPKAPASAPAVAPPTPRAPRPGRAEQYFVTWDPTRAGAAQYEFEVMVNGAVVKHIGVNDPAGFVEITGSIKKGENAVKIIANKNILDSGRTSSSPDDWVIVSVVHGRLTDGKPASDMVIIDMRRTAYETDTFYADAIFRF